jgi:hypothetical protein
MRKALVVLAVLGLSGSLWAADPIIGTWKMNVASSKVDDPNYKMPKSETWGVVIQQDAIKITFDGVSAQGRAYHIEYTGKWDGKDVPVTGDPTAEAFARKEIDTNIIEFVLKKKPGMVPEAWRVTISNDGKTLTSLGKMKGADGQEINATFVYDKQ